MIPAASGLSVLQRVSRADVRAEPFPHLVVENALPADLCDALLASYPYPAALGVDLAANNNRWSVGVAAARANPAVPALWRDFLAYHASAAFFAEFLELFGLYILATHPEHYPDPHTLGALRPGVRAKDDWQRADVLLDAQLGGNTPVRAASSVRGLHVDKGDKLYSGLFYLRRDDDHARGGDLEIHRFRPRLSTWRRERAFNEYSVDPGATEWVTTVPYRQNTLVLFLNSLDSLHGVTVREPTSHCRLFLNLVGEVDPPLYRYPRPEPWLAAPRRLGKRLRRWIGRPAHAPG